MGGGGGCPGGPAEVNIGLGGSPRGSGFFTAKDTGASCVPAVIRESGGGAGGGVSVGGIGTEGSGGGGKGGGGGASDDGGGGGAYEGCLGTGDDGSGTPGGVAGGRYVSGRLK